MQLDFYSLTLNSHTYKDLSKFTGKKDLFTKGLEYSWQKEYRIQLVTDTNEPYVFSIGSIEDIAFNMGTADIEKKVFISDSLKKANPMDSLILIDLKPMNILFQQ